jgi:predicted AAA+ superfamily ATPase
VSIKPPVSDFEIEMHSKLKDRTEFPSRYQFLKAHNGIRPNCLHGLMGSTGCGKSTLVKCIIAEAASGKRVLVWISEENVVDYQELINVLDKSVLSNILFVEEKEIDGQ